MSFDWKDYLSLAEALQENPDQFGLREASYRSSASRAYYAAFQEAFTQAIKDGYSKKSTGDDHVGVQLHFSRSKPEDKTRRKIGQDLSRLKDLRGQADYDDKLDREAKSLAYHATGIAKNIITNLTSLSGK